jgi:type II secretory pathway predicted ATPase ExeA
MEKTLYEFFGLSRTPFSTISGLEDYFHAASRENLLGHIASKILGGSSIVAIRGGRGIGKTSLMRAFASELSARKLTSVSVTDASLTPANVQRLIGEVGGIRNGESMKPDQLLMTLKGQHGIERLILIFLITHESQPISGGDTASGWCALLPR